MRAFLRIVLAVFVVASGFALASCEFLDNFELFDSKKKLPGDRKPVFPEGVPGIQQGIPSEYLHGAQAPPDQPAVPEEALEKPKPKPAPKPKRTAQSQPKPKPQQAQQAQQAQPQSAPPQQLAQPPVQQLRSWPGGQPASAQQQQSPAQQQQSETLDQRWPSAPSSDRFAR
jgi:outer membrane biosynthesis protein TonB